MVVGFVNAGLLSPSKAIGVIMGANIGTTVTSLMLSVKPNFGVLFTAVGAICQLAGNRSSFTLFGQIMMGLGILFVGMDAMTAAMEPLQEWQGFRDMMEWARNPFVGVLVGAGVTALLQSSSASVGILQALAATGAISLQASLFILFWPEHRNLRGPRCRSAWAPTARPSAQRWCICSLTSLARTLFIIIAGAAPGFVDRDAGGGPTCGCRSPLRTSSSTW